MGKLIEMLFEELHTSMIGYQRVAVLREKDAERFLPIWIGPAEADALSIVLQGTKTPRPLVYDVTISIIEQYGGKVLSATITNLQDDVFYASVQLARDGDSFEVDCRPSDALNLAIRTGAAVFVNEEVLEKAGIARWEPGK